MTSDRDRCGEAVETTQIGSTEGKSPGRETASPVISTDTKLVETVATLFDAIKHGDRVHQAWLKEAIDNHFAGKPVPPPRAALTAIQSQTGDASQLCERLRAPEFAEKVALAIETNIGAQADDQEAFFAPRADDDPTITLDCEFDPVEVARVVLEVVSTTLLDALEAPKSGDWQPIETAPRDGTVVLVSYGNRQDTGSVIAARVKPGWQSWSSVPGDYTCKPTHWMPLPPAVDSQ